MGHYSTFVEEDLQKNTVNLLWASKITHVGSSLLFWGVKTRQKATLPKFSGKNPPFFSLKSIRQIAPLFKEESSQGCLLATLLMLLEKSIASYANYH
jgi:hypothetical protein